MTLQQSRNASSQLPASASWIPSEYIPSRLFRKYVALFVIVVSVALLANASFEIWFSYQEHKEAQTRIQREQAESAAAKIGQFIKDIEGQIGWTTQLPWTTSALEGRRFDTLRLLRQVPAITEFAQLDSTGKERLRVSRFAMDAVGTGADFNNDPKFTQAVANKIYYGPVYFRLESEPYMTLAMAGARRDVGVSVAEVNLKFIWDVVSQIKVGKQGRAYVIDAQGRLIAHPDISLVLRNTDMTRFPYVQAARAAPPGVTQEGVQIVKDFQGREVLTAYAPIEPLGWLMFVDLPLDEAYAPLYDSVKRTSILLIGGLTLAFLAGLFLARKMIVPIQRLREGAARIGSGDLTERISIKTGDELESLAYQFNDMAGRLQESYADLEMKVEQRTAELAQSVNEIEEKNRQLAVASQHKSQFLANMSHELRTPLNAILGYTELILDSIYGEVPEKILGVLKRVESNGRHLLGLISDVLDLSKIEAGQLVLSLTDYSLKDVVHNVFSAVEPLASGKKLNFKVEVPPDLPVGHGDERRLTQVLLNLVGNAIKFTDSGDVVIKATAANGSFTVAVRDTGPGISESDQKKIFGEFQQADNSITKKKGGTGLGLAISKRIIEMHGGKIWLDSRLDNGSTFSFTVPVKVEQQKRQA